MNGIYEGNLFVGTRFQDSKQIDDLIIDGRITEEDITDANPDVIRDISFILHGDDFHYQTLKKLKNTGLKEKFGLKNLPHFAEIRYGGLISQYRMSSYMNQVYPAYTIRELYTPDTYDYLILCEDSLTKSFTDYVIDRNDLKLGRCLHITPVGEWENVLKLHADLADNYAVGRGTTLISVLDGDIEDRCHSNPNYKSLKKVFLPIAPLRSFCSMFYIKILILILKESLEINIFSVNL